jgi:hypothetical protein
VRAAARSTSRRSVAKEDGFVPVATKNACSSSPTTPWRASSTRCPTAKYVFTIPRILRVYFRHNRTLLTALCRCAATSLERYLRELLGLPDVTRGIIIAIHTFGDYARTHPHLHAVVADGLFRPNGVFHVAPETDTKPLEELFQTHVLKMRPKAGKIDEGRILMLLGWRLSGFSTHRGNRIARDDREGQEALCQYILRNAFSAEKMTYVAESGTVQYHSNLGHGKNTLNFELFTAEEFIAAITQHIPPKSYQVVRYYGWYSNRARGERKKRGMLRPGDEPEEGRSDDVTVLDVSDYDPPRLTPKTWRQPQAHRSKRPPFATHGGQVGRGSCSC